MKEDDLSFDDVIMNKLLKEEKEIEKTEFVEVGIL